MKQFIYILSFIFILSACNQSSKKKETSDKSSDLSFTTKEFRVVSSFPDIPTSVDAKIDIANGGSEAAGNINDVVFEAIKSIIARDGDPSKDYKELFSGFIDNYEEFVNENKDYQLNWEARMNAKVLYETENVLNIELDSYLITGGAHGNSNKISLLFDPSTGKKLKINDILTNTEEISKMLEKKFRIKYNIPEGESINSTGYMFENDVFVLPQNIFFEKDGLLFYYNPYEVAAYSEGAKDIILSYTDLDKYLLKK